MGLGDFFRDYGIPFASAVAVVNSVITVTISQWFKDSPRARAILVVASILLGSVAVVATFYSQHEIVVARDSEVVRRLATKDLLSASIAEGEALIKSHKESKGQADADAYRHKANEWATKTSNLVEDAYGKAEAAVWGSDAGLTSFNIVNYPTGRILSWMINRLQRSNELIVRVDTILLLPGFDPNNYHWRTECPDC